MVEYQPWSVIATILDYVAYCCVYLPCLPFYSSPHRSYHTSAFAHPGIAHLQPRIPTFLSISTIPWLPLQAPPSPVTSYSFLSAPLQSFPKYASLSPLEATMRLSFDLPPCRPYCLRKLQIAAATLSSVLRLSTVSLCRSYPTLFPPLPTLILSRASPMSHLSTATLV